MAFFPSRTTVTISLRSCRSSRTLGMGTSRTEISFSSSGGMWSVGERRITVVKVLLSACPSSRKARVTVGSLRKGWKSFSTTSEGSESFSMVPSASTGSLPPSCCSRPRRSSRRRSPFVTDQP